MGGFGSTRWDWHRRKATVEASRAFALGLVLDGKPPTPGAAGTLTWGRGAEPSASVGYEVVPGPAVRLRYAWTPRVPVGDPTAVALDVRLVPGAVPNGGARWWGVCPLASAGTPCGRRVGTLYLPPASPYFGCRRCHRLAYRSSQAHDKRVSRLLRNPAALFALAADPRGLPVSQLGLALAALTELERRHRTAVGRFDRRYGPAPEAPTRRRER